MIEFTVGLVAFIAGFIAGVLGHTQFRKDDLTLAKNVRVMLSQWYAQVLVAQQQAAMQRQGMEQAKVSAHPEEKK